MKSENMRNEYLTNIAHYRKLYHKMFAPLGKQYGLTQIEIDILLFLINNPEFNTAKDIVALRGLAKSNISTALEQLKQKDYLEIKKEPGNRRLNRIFLKEKGTERAEVFKERQEEFFTLMLDGISEEMKKTVQMFFQIANENITRALTDRKGED